MTYFMTSLFVKRMFSLIRNVLVCFFQYSIYVSAVLTRLLDALDCKPHETVLKINVSCP